MCECGVCDHTTYHSGAETAPLIACETEKLISNWRCLFTSRTCQTTVNSSRHGLGRRHFRSSDIYTCVVPRTRSQTGDRSFSVAGPQLWNKIPREIRRTGTTFDHYRRLLKAFLFVYAAAHCDFYLSAPDISTLTHSLTQPPALCGMLH